MGLHVCAQEKEIGRLKKILDGNGRLGLVEEMAVMKTNMQNLTSDITYIKTTTELLLEKYNQNLGRIDYKQKAKSYNQWLVALVIGLTLTIAGLIIQIAVK